MERALFECNDEAAAYAAASKQAREQEEREAAQRMGRQAELKEETMQSLSQRRSRQGRPSASRSSSVEIAVEESLAAVDLTGEKAHGRASANEGVVRPSTHSARSVNQSPTHTATQRSPHQRAGMPTLSTPTHNK